MESPIFDLNKTLAILILKAAGCKDDVVAQVIHCSKTKVVAAEQWFKQLSDTDAALHVSDKTIADAFSHVIDTSEQTIETTSYDVASKMKSTFLLHHYGKLIKATAKLPLRLDRHQHYARLTDAAEKLRLNVKDIKESKGTLNGNVTSGHIQVSKNELKSLRNVDRLDAECLLEHLKATFSQFKEIDNWESLTNRELVVLKVSDSLVKKLKEVSHGLALKGTCRICRSWSETQ